MRDTPRLAVNEAVREHVLTRQEPPGAPVTEQAIADRFGVARPAAKAALERLVAEGLLRRTEHKTARVPSLTREDIVDLYANRATLEVAALANLATAVATGAAPVPPAALSAQRELADDVDQHQRIIAAVAAGDADAAARLTRAHIEGARDRLLARYDATRSAPNDEPTDERD